MADQTANRGELAQRIDRGNGLSRCQRYELFAPAKEEWIGDDEERTGMQSH